MHSAPIALSAVFCGIWVSKTLRFQKITWLAWVLLTTGTGLTALMKPDSNAGVLYGLRIVAAVGSDVDGDLLSYSGSGVRGCNRGDRVPE
jgi:hypothetical protein